MTNPQSVAELMVMLANMIGRPPLEQPPPQQGDLSRIDGRIVLPRDGVPAKPVKPASVIGVRG